LRRELLIAAGPGEWRAALTEDGAAVELYVERGDCRRAGSIHLGRVVRVAKSLESAFVDIGDARPGLVPLREATSAGVALDEGARVLVQVRREAQRDKGARLSARIAPREPLSDPAALAERAAPLDPPAQLHPAPGFAASLSLALPGTPDRVVTDDPGVVPELRAAFPAAAPAAEPAGDWPLDLDALFADALAPHLALPGGGTVHIDEAPAAVLIDVDSGTPEAGSAARVALAANLDSARLIARQLRLRNLGGGIVVDFVGLDGHGPRERVREAMTAALAGDPAQPRCLGWTRLGHLEIVRPYRSRSLAAVLLDPRDAPAPSAATLAFAALRAVQREARAEPAAQWRLTVTPSISAVLREAAAGALAALETRLGRPVELTVAEIRDAPSFAIARR